MASTASPSNKRLPAGGLALLLLLSQALLAGSPLAAAPAGATGGGLLYTNIAGQTIAGPVEKVADGQVWFRGRAFPLTIFPEGERARILATQPAPKKPRKEGETARRDAFYQNLLRRQDALEEMGTITHEKAEAQRKKIREAWAKAGEAKGK